ncbi:MAG: peptide ABC transporter permease [Thermofilum sp. ex4484_15]|nr:MAG: peptide ABC transporter permease [Thermofilum sp. ex4484_15]
MFKSLKERYEKWKFKNAAKIEEYRLMFYAFKRSPLSVAGSIMVIIFVILGVFGPWILDGIRGLMGFLYSHGIIRTEPSFNAFDWSLDVLQPPSWKHWFGTDDYGRDIFARSMLGIQVSLVYSLVVLVVAIPIGIILGLIAGYYGGKVDEVISRITDMFLAFPALVLAMAISASLGAGLMSAIIALITVWWPGYVRLIRGQVLSVKENLYIEAARAVGMGNFSIIVKHILPNVISPLIIYTTMDIAGVVLTGANLSFLGLGAQPPTPELGRIVFDGLDYLPEKWWYSLIPGFMLFLFALGFNLLGDGLRDVLDPRFRRRLEFEVKGEKE